MAEDYQFVCRNEYQNVSCSERLAFDDVSRIDGWVIRYAGSQVASGKASGIRFGRRDAFPLEQEQPHGGWPVRL